MRVLGISPLDKDSTVSFLENGEILFACGEERFTRTKLQDGFPHQALRAGLERTGWEPSSLDAVAYAFLDPGEEARLIHDSQKEHLSRYRARSTRSSARAIQDVCANGYSVDRTIPVPGFSDPAEEFMPRKSWVKRALYHLTSRVSWIDWWAHRHFLHRWCNSAIRDHQLRAKQLQEGLAEYGLAEKLRRFTHHDTHAANAFYGSGFDEALLITLDGYGTGDCGGVYRGTSEGIERLHRFRFPNSLGQFYEEVTSGLGFKPGRHEGKIVGLAAYGRPEVLADVLRHRFDCEEGDIRIRGSMNYLLPRALAGQFARRDVAAAWQHVLEEVVQEMVEYWTEKTGLRKVAVSGGVHANVKLNQRIFEVEAVDEVFVYPNMGDGGCATGAALLVQNPNVLQRPSLANVYFGPDYSTQEMERALKQSGVRYERMDEVDEYVGQLVAEHHVVARFAGRMEYGPRALGNRSILYPAQDPAVNQWLNQQLGRTEFMPFAPAALTSEADRLFHQKTGAEKTAEYMTITFDCTDEMKRLCPAAVHVDGTARPQLVSPTTNEGFHRVIDSYHRRTGVPALINTSFNMHEEPIVCSPVDAVRAFLSGRLDYLALGPFVAPHPRLEQISQERTREKCAQPDTVGVGSV